MDEGPSAGVGPTELVIESTQYILAHLASAMSSMGRAVGNPNPRAHEAQCGHHDNKVEMPLTQQGLA